MKKISDNSFPKTAIILVNWRAYAKGYLAEFWESLENQTYPKESFSVFIADNETSPESREGIKSIAQDAHIIPNKENLGWAGGNNTAIKKAQKEDFKYFAIVNMDTVLDKNWLSELVKKAEEDKFDIIQSKIIIPEKNIINSLGNRIQFLGYGYCNCYGKPASCSSFNTTMDYASGASMLVKKEVFARIGFFREEFFMYHDDLEFCWRARLAGFNVGLAEKSICYHKYIFSSTIDHLYYMDRNRLLTLFTLEKTGTIILTLPFLIAFEFAMTFYNILKGWGKERLRLFRYLFSADFRKYIKRVRQEVKKYRRLKDADIVKGFAGKIVFAEIDNTILKYILNPIMSFYWFMVRNLIFW